MRVMSMTRSACCQVPLHSGLPVVCKAVKGRCGKRVPNEGAMSVLNVCVVGQVTWGPGGVKGGEIKVNQVANHPGAAQSCEKNECPAAQQGMGFEVSRFSAEPSLKPLSFAGCVKVCGTQCIPIGNISQIFYF